MRRAQKFFAVLLVLGGTAVFLSTRHAVPAAIAKVEPASPPVKPVVAPAEAAIPPVDPRVATWISQLGSDDVPTRVVAMENLRIAGAKAERELRDAAKSGPDAVKQRAATLAGMLGTAAPLRKIGDAVNALQAYEADEDGMQLIGGQTVKTSGHLAAIPGSKRYILSGDSLAGAMKIHSRIVCDGTTVWSEMELSEQTKNVSRSSRLDLSGFNATLNLDAYRSHYDFFAMREDTLDGKPVWVFSGVIREVIPTEPVKPGPQDPEDHYQPCQICVAFVSKDDSLLRKIEFSDDKGIVTRSLNWSAIRTNTKLDAAQFVYTPPANTDVWNADDQEPAPSAQETAKPTPNKNAEF